MKIKHLLLIVTMMCFGLTAEAQTTGEKIKEFADKHLKLSGYLQGGFEWNQASDPETTFYLRRARVSLSGNAAKEKIDYRLQVDMAGSPKICCLYFRYKPLNEINIQLGQFKLPFSLENELYGPTKFEFIEYSYLTTYLVRNNKFFDGISATGRDMGFQLYGGFIEREGYSIINYNVGVFNGTGINTKDNNSSKDFIARLIVKPIKGLSISGSYMYSYTTKTSSKSVVNINPETLLPELSTITTKNNINAPRWSVGAIYDVRHWIARAEFAQADFGGNMTNAFYALAGYHFEKPWSVAARYEFIRDEHNILNEDRITLGGVYKPWKFLRLQLNYSYTMNAAIDKNYNGINLMVSAIF